MRTLIPLLVVGFVLLPTDAQMLVIGAVRPLWLTTAGQSLGLGLIGATVAALFWYSLGWNAQADSVYREDVRRANEALARRRK